MKISIIVPVYNVEAYIEDCLRSVAAQTYNGEIECIIVNDCTTDNSCSIIEKFIAGYNGNIQFTLLHHDKNRGLSAARNTGIDAATGEYIYFLDSDDEITPYCIELLAAPLANRKYDFVIGDYKTIGSEKEFPPLRLEEGEITTNSEIRKQHFQGNWYMMAWNKLCNLGFLRNEKLYFKEGLINEDNLWSFQLACLAQTMYVAREPAYLYKVRETSIMGVKQQQQWLEAYSTTAQEMYHWAKDKGYLEDKQIFNKILYFRNIVYSIIFSQKTARERKRLYLIYHKKMHFSPIIIYKYDLVSKRSMIRELYNSFPGMLGYWYLCLYRMICKNKM